MTTISPNRRRNKANTRLIFIATLTILVIGVITIAREPLAGLLWRALSPLSYARDIAFTNLGNVFGSFTNNHALVTQNSALRAELASTSNLLEGYYQLYRENLELKQRFGRVPPKTLSTLATVIARPPGVPYDTLMIDVGKNAGVEVGDLVSSGGIVYIGSVRDVYATSARVVLFSAPGETFNAILSIKSATSSLAISVKGQGGGSLTSQVPAGSEVHAGDEVIFESIAPELVARVTHVDEGVQASFKTIFMHLPVNIYELRHVEVRPSTNHETGQ